MNSNDNDVLRIYVYSKNQKGKSQGVFITEFYIGSYKKQSSDLKTDSSSASPILLGIFLTVSILGAIVIAKLYWKSRKIKREIVEDDKFNLESRCSLLKQDTFAVNF